MSESKNNSRWLEFLTEDVFVGFTVTWFLAALLITHQGLDALKKLINNVITFAS